MVFETIAFADFAIRAGRSQPTMGPVRPRRVLLLVLVAAAAFGYRQYRLSQAPDPAAAVRPVRR
jgi:hypothetical protein